MERILAGLNDQQQIAVKSFLGTVVVMAPIGTGKTKVIAHRTAYACWNNVDPHSILCLSFTNKAAKEMKERISGFMYEESKCMRIGTFHSFCNFVIRNEADRLGLDSDFVIYDEEDCKEMLSSINKKYSVHSENDNLIGLVDYFKMRGYKKKNEMDEIRIGTPEFHKLFSEYNDFLTLNHALDFNDLILNVIKLFKENKDVLRKWQSRYQWIQIDEFQDVNLAEFHIIKLLSEQTKNISFFGDLDQTIYEWRGSMHEKILKNIHDSFSPIKQIPFTKNYRSTKNILFGANHLIRKCQGSVTQKIEPQVDVIGDKICVHREYNVESEAKWIADKIKGTKKSNSLNYKDFAVLTRTNGIAASISEVFERENLPHFVIEQFKFFRRAEIKDAVAYIKYLLNKYDLNSFRRLLQKPTKGIGDVTIDKVLSLDPAIGLKLTDFSDISLFKEADPFGVLLKAYRDGNLVVFDTETTGLDITTDEIIEIAAVKISPRGVVSDFQSCIKPGRSVGSSEKVHGLTDEFLAKEGKESRSVMSQFLQFIEGGVVVGHNVNYDISILCNELGRLGLKHPGFLKYYDTLDISRRFYRFESYTLSCIVEQLGIPVKPTHRAMDDVVATAALLTRLIERIEETKSLRQKEVLKYYSQFEKVASQIDMWRSDMQQLRPNELLSKILRESKLLELYKTDANCERRLKNLDELVKVFSELDDTSLPPMESLRSIVSVSALGDDRDRIINKDDKALIITAHQSKGLEFDTVFIAGATDNCFPSFMAQRDGNVNEEHRLFYVAMTRAKRRLIISFHEFNQYKRHQSPSRYLSLIPSQFMNFT